MKFTTDVFKLRHVSGRQCPLRDASIFLRVGGSVFLDVTPHKERDGPKLTAQAQWSFAVTSRTFRKCEDLTRWPMSTSCRRLRKWGINNCALGEAAVLSPPAACALVHPPRQKILTRIADFWEETCTIAGEIHKEKRLKLKGACEDFVR